MRWGVWLALGGAAWIGGCSWIPFLNSDAPELRNPAVEACLGKADDLGYDGAGERESAPLGEGRYTVVLDVRQNQGFGQVTCNYDPKKGADLPPPQPATPEEKPAETPAQPAAPTVVPQPAPQPGPQPIPQPGK
jgi:hypothetical protein